MHYRVTHTTEYEYQDAVSHCQNLAHLTPRDTYSQRCLSVGLTITPRPAVLAERVDYFGNTVTFFAVEEPHLSLVVTASHLMELQPRELPPVEQSMPWEEARQYIATDRSPESLDAYQFVFDSRYARASKDLAAYAAASFTPGRPLLEAAIDLTKRIHRDFTYDPQATTVSTPLDEVFAKRRGVCQDFAHLEIACIRSLGLAARYVSGYLRTNTPAGQERLVGADATHAWVSVYCPRNGWLELDPTNDAVPTDKHVLMAWGRDYDDVSPIKGVILGGGHHSVGVAVHVARADV